MITLLTNDDLAKVRQSLGVLHADIQDAAKTAMRKLRTWAGREAAKDISEAAKIPYRASRVRVKARVRARRDLEVWFGLNEVSAKYLKAGDRKKSFTNNKLRKHYFRRRGKARLPIDRVNKEIEQAGMKVASEEFPEKAKAMLIQEFFLALDRKKGRGAGTSQYLANL